MSFINRKFFFDNIRLTLFDGRLRQSQVDGLTVLLNEWENKHVKKDDRWLAYMLATTHHETDRKIQPIEEYGKEGQKIWGTDSETGQVYFGRAFVQLTWQSNYEKMSKVVKTDLVHHPKRALDLKIATLIFFGMMNGSFAGKMLSDDSSPQSDDWVNVRKIINGLDKANRIASYAKTYYAAISYTTG